MNEACMHITVKLNEEIKSSYDLLVLSDRNEDTNTFQIQIVGNIFQFINHESLNKYRMSAILNSFFH